MLQHNFLLGIVVLFLLTPAKGQVPIYAVPDVKLEQPATAGKPLGFWIDRLHSEYPNARARAVEMIDEGYPQAQDIWELGFVGHDTISLLEGIRTEIKPHVPMLLDLLKRTKDEDVFSTSAALLTVMGLEAHSIAPDVKRLILRNELNGQERMSAFLLLLSVIPEDQPVGPVMIELLKAMPEKTRKDIAENSALETVGFCIPITAGSLIRTGHTKVEVPYLVKVAQGDFPIFVRALAIGTLGSLEFEARAAVPALEKLLRDKDLNIQYMAAGALMTIQQEQLQLPAIVEALGVKGQKRREIEQGWEEYFESKNRERKQLEAIVQERDLLFPTLAYLLKHGHGCHRRHAIRRIAIIGREAKFALPDLKKALGDDDEETRQLAADAIRAITAD